jgi:pilus assembly protein CpaF
MRPDRVIVGECRGGETLDMLQAMNTGHEGSMTTIHSNSPIAALLRLETMSLQAEQIDLPSRVVREQIASAVDVIVQIERVAHRHRRITSICEVVGVDDDDGSIIIEEIYDYRRRQVGGGIRISRLSFTGYVPSFFETLAAAGADVRCLR